MNAMKIQNLGTYFDDKKVLWARRGRSNLANNIYGSRMQIYFILPFYLVDDKLYTRIIFSGRRKSTQDDGISSSWIFCWELRAIK